MSSGRQQGELNAKLFAAWAASKTDDDFRAMANRGVLSRKVGTMVEDSFDSDGNAVTVGFDDALVRKDVGAENAADERAEMRHVVHVGQRRRDEHVALAALGQNGRRAARRLAPQRLVVRRLHARRLRATVTDVASKSQ